ncbi:MAG: helix-turn-helix transcriptional regulator [Acidimicrobiales bacterium]
MRLDERDLRAVLDVATRLMADPPPPFADVLEGLRSLIACTSASFNDMTMASGDYRHLVVPPDDEALATELAPAYDRFADQHPLVARMLADPGCGALRLCDVPEGAHFTDTDLYQRFYAAFDVRYQLVLSLPSPPDVVVGYALNRREDQGEFSDRDVAILDTLVPHLAMHHRAVLVRERSLAMEHEAERDGWTVAIVRSDGTVESTSPRHPPGLRSATPLVERQRVPAEIAELLPADRTDRPRASHHELTIGEERWHCVIRSLPIGPTVLMARRVGSSAEKIDLGSIGLTPRQTDVARALAETGGTNAQLASTLGLSTGTVKKHLEAVFQALEVDNRAAAVAILRTMLD